LKGVKTKVLAVGAVVGATAVFPGATSWASQHAALSFVPTVPIAATPAISTLDPSQWGAQIMIDQGTVMEGLYGYSPTGQIVPKIATGYSVSKNGLVWTFYLRHNARWSNGAPVTANDFYYSWMRTASPTATNDALWASVMTYVSNAWAYHAGSVPASAVGVKVVNPFEIQLTLSAPHDILGSMVISGSMPLYPPSVEAHPTNWYLPQYFVGDGPYVVKSFTPNGEITLARNPFYIGAPGEENVGNIQEMNLIPQSSVPVEDYLANRLSAAVIMTPSDYKYVLEHPALKAELRSQPDNQIMYLEWDKSVQASPLDNLAVRQAIAMAIDRQPIVDNVLSGMAGATNVFGYPGWPTYSLQHPLTYNVQKARKLLAKAGYPNGKGFPTLTIYAEVASVNPNSIPVAEAVQEELKINLGINSQITPEPSTEYGNITWGGLNPGVKPGYIIGGGTPNWDDVTSLPIQANQQILFHGTIGPASYRQHDSLYYFPTYDPQDVAQLGNPNNPSEGTKPADWARLNKVAEADIAYLAAWTKKQPAAYQAVLNVPGQETYQQQWDNYLKAWHQAKTPSQLHQAWVNAWKFIGDWSAGNGGANVGLNGLVWDDQHMTKGVYLATMWNAELNGALSQAAAVPLAAKIDNFMLQNGWGVPLYYLKTFYLLKPGLSGIEANPWSWGGLYQMQYLSYKP